MSQKTVYLAWKSIHDFFKWAKMHRLAFFNPTEDIEVKAPVKNPEGLALDEQKRLVTRWLDTDTDALAVCPIGIIARWSNSIYGTSSKRPKQISELYAQHA